VDIEGIVIQMVTIEITPGLITFQHIYALETRGQSAGVRAKLNREACCRAMGNARKAPIPKSPPTIEEVIDELEHRRHPQLYQDMYLGHVRHEVAASKC